MMGRVLWVEDGTETTDCPSSMISFIHFSKNYIYICVRNINQKELCFFPTQNGPISWIYQLFITSIGIGSHVEKYFWLTQEVSGLEYMATDCHSLILSINILWQPLYRAYTGNITITGTISLFLNIIQFLKISPALEQCDIWKQFDHIEVTTECLSASVFSLIKWKW